MHSRIALAVAPLVVALSCTSGSDVVEENREAAEAKLALMRNATTAALAEPVTTPPELPEKLRFSDPPNAYLVHPEWLAVPPQPREHEILTQTNGFITVRNTLMGTDAATGVADHYRQVYAGFLGVRWLVVVDTASFSGGAKTSDSTFAAGGVSATLHCVDLEKGGSVGSLPLSAGSSDKVEVVVGDEAAHLSSDVWMNAREAVKATLAPLVADGEKIL